MFAWYYIISMHAKAADVHGLHALVLKQILYCLVAPFARLLFATMYHKYSGDYRKLCGEQWDCKQVVSRVHSSVFSINSKPNQRLITIHKFATFVTKSYIHNQVTNNNMDKIVVKKWKNKLKKGWQKIKERCKKVKKSW